MAFGYPNVTRHARRRLLQLGATGARLHFALVAGVGIGLVLALGSVLFSAGALAGMSLGVAVYLSGVVLAGIGLHRGYPHEVFGFCNSVTLLRLALVGVLTTSLLADPVGAWVVFVLAAVALALDGVDGWLARRENLVSVFGARFDMEVDSALALVLALSAFLNKSAGPLVILLGLPRYAFAGAALVMPWLNRPLPDRFSRKAVCVLQLATLIGLQAPILPPMMATVLVICTSAALIWSFERDVVWLWRSRA